MNHWFRLYNTLVDDPKVQQLPETLFKALINLWCIASQNDGALPSADDIGYKLRVKPQKAAELVTRLVKAGLIDNVDGVFIPHNWDNRQFQSDSSTDRVKKHRDKKKGNVPGNVSSSTEGNVPETPNGTDRAEQNKPEQSTADGRALDELGLKNEKALCALFTALCLNLNRSPPDLRPINGWLLDGIATGTISAAVTPILKRKADMKSLGYCDAAVREAHAAAGPDLQVAVTNSHFVEQGTLEWACWESEYRRLGKRPPPCKDTRIENVIRTGWWFPSPIPENYDPCTGEYHPPAEENAA